MKPARARKLRSTIKARRIARLAEVLSDQRIKRVIVQVVRDVRGRRLVATAVAVICLSASDTSWGWQAALSKSRTWVGFNNPRSANASERRPIEPTSAVMPSARVFAIASTRNLSFASTAVSP
jgi:hypothetical protein